jgi:hypothetical protein
MLLIGGGYGFSAREPTRRSVQPARGADGIARQPGIEIIRCVHFDHRCTVGWWRRWPTMMARIGILKALNRRVARVSWRPRTVAGPPVTSQRSHRNKRCYSGTRDGVTCADVRIITAGLESFPSLCDVSTTFFTYMASKRLRINGKRRSAAWSSAGRPGTEGRPARSKLGP